MSEEKRPTSAVLLLGFGGPDSLEAIAPFMTNLMGREPSEELLEQVTLRYLAVGGASPLPAVAQQIAQGIEAKLLSEGVQAPVAIGMRYWHPFIGDVLRGMYEWGIRKVVTVSLSPFETAVATGAYREAIEAVLPELPGLEIVEAPPLGAMQAYSGMVVAGVVDALTNLKEVEPLLAVFTAHSLPVEDLADDDPYVGQIRWMVDGVVESLGMPIGEELDGSGERLPGIRGYGNLRDPQPWVFAYQSKGERGGEWLGPDIDDVVDAAIEGGFKGIAVCPIAFATDHLETLYDLDIVLAGKVLEAGLEFSRAPVPNDDSILIDGIAGEVEPLL